MIYLKDSNTPLKYAINDKLVEEKNGRYDLEFEYPMIDDVYKQFKKFMILKAKTPKLGYQEFYITDIQKTNKGVKIFAKHVFFLTSKLFVRNIQFKKVSGGDIFREIKAFVNDKNDFTFYSDIVDVHSISMENRSLYEVLCNADFSILKLWKGTYLRDNFNIKLLNRRGVDTEYIVAKRKNISDLNVKEDADFVVTKLYLRAKKRNDKESAEEEWFETEVESPMINKYPFVFAQYREYTDSFRTIEALKKYGEELFSIYHIDLPKETFTLKCTDEINSYNLDINDTVLIYYEDYNIHKKIEVTSYTYSPMQGKYLDLTFGYRGKSLADTLTIDTNKKIEKEAKKINQLADETRKGIASINSDIEKKISEKEAEINKETVNKINSATFTIEQKLSDKEKEIRDEIRAKISEITNSLKSLVNEELEHINLEIDEERVKALSNAETEKYIRSKKGKQELINSITADVVWLKAIVTNTEMLNAIVAKIDLAQIKKLIVDTAFIQQIISKQEFTQQFENMGADVTNIFSKLKDSITIAIQTKFKDDWGNVKSEFNSLLDVKSKEIISSISETTANEISKIQIGTRNLARNSQTFDKNSWKLWGSKEKIFEEIKNKENWNGLESINFKGVNFRINSEKVGFYDLVERDTHYLKFEKDKIYTISFDAINLSNVNFKFKLRGFENSNLVELKAGEQKRVVLTATKEDASFSQIEVLVNLIGQEPKFSCKFLKVEEGNKATGWSPAFDDLEATNKKLSDAIEYLESDNKDLLSKFSGLNLENAKLKQEISTNLKQARDEFLFQFNNYKQLVNENNQIIEGRFNDISKYIRFKNGSIELGDVSSPFILLLTHEKISFLKNGFEVAYLSNNRLFITDVTITNSARIGNFEFVPRPNGNLSFRKVVD